MKKQLFATQGGGMAEIIGSHAYFVDDLDVKGQYKFSAGDRVPDQWDLVPVNEYIDSKSFEENVADMKRINDSILKSLKSCQERFAIADDL